MTCRDKGALDVTGLTNATNVTNVMIPMNRRPAIPAWRFARDRRMTEVVPFQETLNTGGFSGIPL
jgi:hypothetical protein